MGCEYCENQKPDEYGRVFNKDFLDLMTDDSDIEGDEIMDSWGVPYIEGNTLTTFYAGTLGDITKKFKINFCPVCGRKL